MSLSDKFREDSIVSSEEAMERSIEKLTRVKTQLKDKIRSIEREIYDELKRITEKSRNISSTEERARIHKAIRHNVSIKLKLIESLKEQYNFVSNLLAILKCRKYWIKNKQWSKIESVLTFQALRSLRLEGKDCDEVLEILMEYEQSQPKTHDDLEYTTDDENYGLSKISKIKSSKDLKELNFGKIIDFTNFNK